MTSLFSRLQKLNKEATEAPWSVSHHFDARLITYGDPVKKITSVVQHELAETDAALIVECRNSLPAVLNLIEAAQEYIERENPLDAEWLREALAPFVEEQA